MDLDSTDKKILEILQKDAEKSYAEIAKEIGVSSSGVHKRVKQLKEQKIIQKTVTKINPKKIGKKLKAFIGVSTKSGRCEDVRPKLTERKEVLEVHEMAGEHDLFLKLVTDGPSKLNKVLHEIDRISGVESTRTSIVLKTEKETSKISIS